MELKRIRKGNEHKLQDFLHKQGKFNVCVAKRPDKKLKLKIIAEEAIPITLDNFHECVTLFGPRLIGTQKRPVRFDLVARTIPWRANIYIIELKAGDLALRDIHQLLGYINLVRHLQRYGGKEGLRLLSDVLHFPITQYTKIYGLLIGRKVRKELLAWMPEEVLEFCKTMCF